MMVSIAGYGESMINIIKIGYVDDEEIFNAYPGIAEVRQKLKDERDHFQGEIDRQKEVIAQLERDYQQNADRMSDEERQRRESELEYKKELLSDLIDESNKKLAALKEELTKPINLKIAEVIRKVSQEKGYSFVFKRSSGVLLYSDPKFNITGEVRSRLYKELSIEERN